MDDDKRFEATAMPDRDWWAALWPDPRAVLEAIGVGPGVRVVDLCSGDGYFTVPLAELTGVPTVGIDLDPAMIAATEAAAEAAGVDNLVLIEADAMTAAEVVTSPVDLVLIANTFHGAADKTGLARAARALLRDGGRFVVINWWPRPREQTQVLGAPRGPRDAMRFSPEQVAAWVTPAGFVLTEAKDVGPYHYAAVFETSGMP